MTILFLAIEYPPLNTAGVFRSWKFAKYLPSFGIKPVVLTLDEGNATTLFGGVEDSSLLEDAVDGVEVIRVKFDRLESHARGSLLRFLRVYFQIEDRIGRSWRRSLMRRLPDIVEKYKPRAIYVSLPPFSAGRLALDIARRYQLPLIVDMRDGWSQWRVGPFASWFHYYLTVRRERALLLAASLVVTVTQQLATMFARTHSAILGSDIRVITNGYDFDLSLPDTIEVPSRATSSHILIGYVGNFYYEPEKYLAHMTPWWKKRLHRKIQFSSIKEDWLYRSPYFFLRALSHLFERRPEFREMVRFEVMGVNAEWLREMSANFGIADCCTFHPRSRYADVLRFQEQCDAFLATSVKVPDGEDYAIASKTFEYLRYGKPIVGFVSRGAQRDFLLDSGVGVLCDPDNVEASTRSLERVIDGGFALQPDLRFLSRFHRRELALELARAIRDVAA